MEIVYIKIEELKPAEYNPRKWSEETIEQIKTSIQEFGLLDPIIVNQAENRKNIVIGGHLRLFAAKELGFTEMPVVYINIPDEQKERELNLRLNKNLGEWEWNLLANFDEELLKLVGFNSPELDKIFDLKIAEDEFDADKEYQNIEEPQTKLGDLYQLGDHKLLCGDSTKEEDISKLMKEEKADLIFTDPPYNVGYDYWGFRGTRKHGVISKKIFNDNKSIQEYEDFIYQTSKNAFNFSKSSACFYWWHASSFQREVRNGLEKSNWHISQTLIWLKNYAVFAVGQDYHRLFEPCFFGWKNKEKHFVNKGQDLGKLKDITILDFETFEELLDVLYANRDSSIEYKHPTQKPIRLIERALKRHSNQNDIVLDFFGGSGSTLMGCEQMQRKARLMELDPKYVSVILQRWSKYTGQDPVREDGVKWSEIFKSK